MATIEPVITMSGKQDFATSLVVCNLDPSSQARSSNVVYWIPDVKQAHIYQRDSHHSLLPDYFPSLATVISVILSTHHSLLAPLHKLNIITGTTTNVITNRPYSHPSTSISLPFPPLTSLTT